MNKFCQSCGFPMKKGKKGGGSNADGSISDKYCSMCFEDGEFLSSIDIDAASKFQKYCIHEMKKDGMNGVFAWLASRGIIKVYVKGSSR